MIQNQFTDENIWQYCLDHTSKLSDSLQDLSDRTVGNIHGSQMISEKIITTLLQFFTFSQQAKICVDVGTYTGMSAVAMAEAMPSAKVYTIDRAHQGGKLIAEDILPRYPNIIYVNGDAKDIIPTLPDNIDIAFIDADKNLTQTYFDLVFDKLSDKGVIIVDDILWKGEVLNPQDRRAKVLDDFNKYVNSRDDVDNLILPIRHGVNIIKKRLSSQVVKE